ncbi:MAG: hypothetical protein ACK4TO_04470 [Candidatus Nitrosotenuis sp.]
MLRKTGVFLVLLIILAPVYEAFAQVGTQRAEIKNPRLVNTFGEPISQNINVNQQIQVSADVTNKQANTQNFVYIVQILDSSQVTRKLSWFSASLNSQQTLSPAISWSTDIPGIYTAEIYVWDSIKDASALSPATKIKIIVS